MDTITLVEAQIDDGLSLLDRLRENGLDIDVSCWIKSADEDRWSLYIATPLVDRSGPMVAYREVNRVLRSMGSIQILDSQIKLIGTTNRIAKEVRELQKAFSGHKSRLLLGGMFVDEIYLYAPTGRTPVTIYGLVFRGAPLGTLHLSFEQHSPHSKMTVEGKDGLHEYPAQVGVDWVVAVPDRATLERDKTGRLVLSWELHGKRRQSDAQTVFSLAQLGLHGFRLLREPAVAQPS